MVTETKPLKQASAKPVAINIPAHTPERKESTKEAAGDASGHKGYLSVLHNLSAEQMEIVTIEVPKSFILRLDNQTTISICQGVHHAERYIAEHWYSIAHGVKIFK